jgi:hypothetical protein
MLFDYMKNLTPNHTARRMRWVCRESGQHSWLCSHKCPWVRRECNWKDFLDGCFERRLGRVCIIMMELFELGDVRCSLIIYTLLISTRAVEQLNLAVLAG